MSYTTVFEVRNRIDELTDRLDEIPGEILDYFENDTDAFTPVAEALDSWDGFLGDDRCYSMYEFDDLFCGLSPLDIAEKIYGGDFNPNDDYFYFSIYGVESCDYPDYSDRIDDYLIDEIIDNRCHIEYELPDEIIELLDELDEIPDEIEELTELLDELEADNAMSEPEIA